MHLYRVKLLVIALLLTACAKPTLNVNHPALLTLDTHIDIPITLGLGDADPRQQSPMQVDIPKMRRGGLDAGFFIVYVKQAGLSDVAYAAAYEQAQAKFIAIERMLANSPEQLQLARSPKALQDIVATGRIAVAIGIENAYPLGANLEHLDAFYERGARYISLTHFGHNHVGDSSAPLAEQKGKTESLESGFK